MTAISTKDKPVVLLIDEYDKPIVDFLTEHEQAKVNQHILRRFFGPLKDLETQGHLHFLFITGVSKFSKGSLFSDLNNLTNLSVSSLSHDLLGITEAELLTYFDAYIEQVSQTLDMSREVLLRGIKLWYDGYSYDAETFLYNPFSLLNFFNEARFANFWFATGTPTFLVETIRDRGIDPKALESEEVDSTFFDKFSLEGLDITGLLFQTGYLTIKKTRRRQYETMYTLGYPNMEVYRAFIHNLIQAFTYKVPSRVGNAMIKMQRGLEEGRPELFVEQLEIILSDISYHLTPRNRKQAKQTAFEMWEGYFHTIIYLLTSYMDLHVESEIT